MSFDFLNEHESLEMNLLVECVPQCSAAVLHYQLSLHRCACSVTTHANADSISHFAMPSSNASYRFYPCSFVLLYGS